MTDFLSLSARYFANGPLSADSPLGATSRAPVPASRLVVLDYRDQPWLWPPAPRYMGGLGLGLNHSQSAEPRADEYTLYFKRSWVEKSDGVYLRSPTTFHPQCNSDHNASSNRFDHDNPMCLSCPQSLVCNRSLSTMPLVRPLSFGVLDEYVSSVPDDPSLPYVTRRFSVVCTLRPIDPARTRVLRWTASFVSRWQLQVIAFASRRMQLECDSLSFCLRVIFVGRVRWSTKRSDQFGRRRQAPAHKRWLFRPVAAGTSCSICQPL